MLTLPSSVRIYMASEPVDLRKGFDGLGALVRSQWGHDILDGHLFVFLGRRLDRCKILFWDRGGMVVYYKRLEQGRFRLPRQGTGLSVELTASELVMLLDGLDFARVRRAPRWERPQKRTA